MGSSASKSASSGAKTAARHFPSMANIAAQERAAAAAASAARQARAENLERARNNGITTGSQDKKEKEEKGTRWEKEDRTLLSSPKTDYLEKQRKLEEQIAQYDEAIKKSRRDDGGSRPFEDTPSAAEMQFFGNLKTVGQVEIHNPDQVKHHEAEAALKRKLPQKSQAGLGSSFATSSNLPSSAQSAWTSATAESAAYASGATLTSLKLMQLLSSRNQDPSVWTEDKLAEEFEMRKEDVQAVTRYINTYTIVPGKDAKGRESGVWCEDLRGVEVVDKAKELEEAKKAAAAAGTGVGAGSSTSTSKSPSSSSSSSSSSPSSS
ncbi:hypothetical protein BGZ94_002877 [Podila epigama]|nr:hypothetical protein BGZ94_002877 [Podila epigama]